MGITRDSRHKHRLTGGRVNIHIKKRKFEMGRPSAMTKIGKKRVRTVRTRGGNTKFRALKLESGNYSWGTENCTRKVRILDVVYNATNNELVRTKSLVKNMIVAVDAAPFRTWYAKRYGIQLGKKKKGDEEAEDHKASGHVEARQKARREDQANKLSPAIAEQFNSGRLMACIASRPGQSGRADGYILEGPELDFYKKKLDKKKK